MTMKHFTTPASILGPRKLGLNVSFGEDQIQEYDPKSNYVQYHSAKRNNKGYNGAMTPR